MAVDECFGQVIGPYLPELRLHAYRMLGSSYDSDDVVQETLLRAWRARHTLGDVAKARAWLYRIATNVCLDELRDRGRRPLPSDVGTPGDPAMPPAAASPEVAWLEPCPDAWLASVVPAPGAAYELNESIALAFLAALQALSPGQRAVLILRDVVGLSADETAEALEMTVSAANSALFRARTALEARRGTPVPGRPAATADFEPALLARYVRAWHAHDVDALVALLREDVTTTMPPSPTWIAGRDANAEFYRRMFDAQRSPATFRLSPTRANGQPAFGFYRAATGTRSLLRAIEVLDLRDGAVTRIDHFMNPQIFALFGLPETLEP